MKVLIVTGEFPPMEGGVGDYTREIGQALQTLGCQVHVVTSVHAGPQPGILVHPLVEQWSWGCWGVIRDLIRQHRPDVIHIQYQAAAYTMHPAINLLPWRLRRLGSERPQIVVTFHDLKVPYLFPKAGPLRRWVINELARRSDAAISTNREDYEVLRQRLISPPALIPIGSNIAPELPTGFDRTAWRARWGAGPKDILLCFFGFVNDRKGVDTLLRALKLATNDPRRKTNASLLMIGGQTGASDPTNVAYLTQIQTMISELGLASRVHWTGFVPATEVTANFVAADICVLPFRDGVSFLHGTLHAALAHGMPIITTRPRVALPELEDRGNIFLVPREQPQALTDAILELAAAPDLRRILSDGAQALAKQYCWDKIATDTLDLYRILVPHG